MSEKYENSILFDWLSVSYGGPDFVEQYGETNVDELPWEMLCFLRIDHLPFEIKRGFYGFAHQLVFQGIHIHFGRHDNFILLDMSGEGCRTFDTYSKKPDWNYILKIFSEQPYYKITRIDVAYDDFKGLLKQSQLDYHMQQHNIVTHFQNYGVQERSYVKPGYTLFFGSLLSNVYVRIYDKAAERGREEEIKHWVRFELQIRHNHAVEFVKNYVLLDYDIGMTFLGVVNKYMRFVKPCGDSNKSRWDTADFWLKFVGDVEKINLYSHKDLEYNEFKLQSYVVGQAGQAIQCFTELYGRDQLFEMINEYTKQHQKSINPKYQKLIDNVYEERFKNGEGIPF